MILFFFCLGTSSSFHRNQPNVGMKKSPSKAAPCTSRNLLFCERKKIHFGDKPCYRIFFMPQFRNSENGLFWSVERGVNVEVSSSNLDGSRISMAWCRGGKSLFSKRIM